MSPRALLFVATLINLINGFTPSSTFLRPRSKLSYAEEYESSAIDTYASMEARVHAAMASTDIIQMKNLLTEMYHWHDACTEEGNQIADECDLVVKGEREVLMSTLEDSIASVFMSTAMTVMAMSGGPIASSTIDDEVQACLSGARSFSTDEMESMLSQLEELQSGCTEEGNQTNQECDIVVKAQRDVWIRKLERKIADPMTQIRSKLEKKTCSLGQLTEMLHFLEGQTNSCTEEGNQTKDECDIIAKAEREDLMELLEAQIVFQQGKASKSTAACLQYKLCDPAQLAKTYAELEELNNLCTEEGNQTRSFCSLETKDQREEMMAKLEYELTLARKVIVEQRRGNVPSFQI